MEQNNDEEISVLNEEQDMITCLVICYEQAIEVVRNENPFLASQVEKIFNPKISQARALINA